MRTYLWIFIAFGFLLVVQAFPQSSDPTKDYQEEEPEDDEDEDDETGPPPVLVSKNETFVVDVGKTALLPCKVENAANAVIIWWMDVHTLWTGGIPMGIAAEHENFKLQKDHSLLIENVKPSDSNIYKCTVIGGGGKEHHQVVVYKLHVSVPPQIVRIVPSGQKKVVDKGTPLTLMCEASGFPTPNISWTKKGKHGSHEEKFIGPRITIDSVNRKHSGTYECKASNEHGESEPMSIEVQVLYEPEVETEKPIVNAGEGYETELVCIVHGEPKVKVQWYKEDQPISFDTRHISQHHDGKKHILRISGTRKTDFGVYRCTGNNLKGTNSQIINLSGKPTKPIFNSASGSSDGKSPELSWKIESFVPISEYELLYRPQDGEEWKSVFPIVEKPTIQSGNVYIAKQVLTGLLPRSYQAELRAKNSYGWSEMSEPHTFSGQIEPPEETPSETGPLEAVVEGKAEESSTASELRISFAFVTALLVAQYYC